jgi:hypothetical protein
MAASWKSLARIASIPPEAWDALVPHGPVARVGEDVALNPQPLPPHEEVVGARLLDRILLCSIIVVGGRDGVGQRFLEDIEDWCGTGSPGKHPCGGWDDAQVFAGAAVAAAALTEQYGHDAEMQDALGAAAERLADRAGR